jgi:hypothetical protein
MAYENVQFGFLEFFALRKVSFSSARFQRLDFFIRNINLSEFPKDHVKGVLRE